MHGWLQVWPLKPPCPSRHLRFPNGNFIIITLDPLLKDNAIVGNTGRFGNEIDLAGSVGLDGMKVDNDKPQKSLSLCDRPATGHRSFEMSCFFNNQVVLHLSVEVLDGNHSLQERSPARLGEVLTVLAQRHAGVVLLSRLKALSRVNTDVIVL